jgi:thiol-disulfide isomerase/thioredoxin
MKLLNKTILLPLLAVAGLGTYVYVAGTTGACASCEAITQSLGLSAKPAEKAEEDFACCASAEEEVEASNTTNDKNLLPAPSWSLTDINGKQISSEDLKGRVVLIDFWATWCPPCRKMIPNLIKLDETYQDHGLAVVGISLDEDGAKSVKPFNEKNGVKYLSLLGSEDVIKAFGGITSIPTSFLIDRKGNIVRMHQGYVPLEQMMREVKPLL